MDTTAAIQTDFLGVSAVYHGFPYMPESEDHGMNDEYRAIDFARLAKVRLRVARSYYGSDWAMPLWGGPFQWDSERMTAFYSWLQRMKDIGTDVAIIAGGWDFPSTTCSHGGTRRFNACDPTFDFTCTPRLGPPHPDDVEIFAAWLSESIRQIVTIRGFSNVKYITLFAEPDRQVCPPKLPAQYQNNLRGFYNHVAAQIDAKLRADAVRHLVKLVGPNTRKLGTWVTESVKDLNSVLDIYSSHAYDKPYDEYYTKLSNALAVVKPTGKALWMDEGGHLGCAYRETGDYGTFLAEMYAAVINAGAQTAFVWLYEDQHYVPPVNTGHDPAICVEHSLHKFGTHPWIPDSPTAVRPSWHAYSLLSRFFGCLTTSCSAAIVYDSTKSAGGVRIAASQLGDGAITVLVVNSSQGPREVRVSFSSPIGVTLYRRLYDPNGARPNNDDLIPVSREYANVTDGFEDVLPARGVAVYSSRLQ